VVASKYSRNHFVSEKYKIVLSFTLHFLQHSPLLQLRTFAKTCEGVGNISGSHFVEAVAFFFMSVAMQKSRPFTAELGRGTGKKSAGARSR
jgi:hypothetical protein